MSAAAIRVMIVDDSAVVRQVLGSVLQSRSDIRVIATAADPLLAWPKLRIEWPDVIVLDVEMPRVDGITFLRQLMQERPTPVVICSTLTERGASTTLEALAAGAVGIVTKPRLGIRDFLTEQANMLIQAVREAAASRPRAAAAPVERIRPVAEKSAVTALHETTDKVIAIGTSTGGTVALERVLTELPEVCPGIVAVQHMPEKFTAAFASRLDAHCALSVKEASSGDRVRPGSVLIAPGGRHMRLTRQGAHYHVEVTDGPPVNRHKPSVDVLFRSVAQHAGRNATGILMTGMGDDGARGLLELRERGGHTIAQDEQSCVVFGMPREAIRLGAAIDVLPLERISHEISRIPL